MDDACRELVKDWLTRADHDLRSARALSELAEPLLDTAIYHCQQAGEKAVKAWLQAADATFPRTHDIEILVQCARDIEPSFDQLSSAASVLTPYATAYRYPGGFDEPMPTGEEYDEAFRFAQTICDFVLERLSSDLHP